MKNDSSNENIAKDNYATSDILRDGRTLHIRSIRADDKQLLQESWQALSKQSQYFRFFTPKDERTEGDLVYFTEIDLVNHVGLGASIFSDDAEVPVASVVIFRLMLGVMRARKSHLLLVSDIKDWG